MILTINAGSSSIKAALFAHEQKKPVWEIHADWEKDFESALEKALHTLPTRDVDAIGHRVVHGGETFHQTTKIDASVKQQIQNLCFLAPLHNPINLAGIETCERLFPRVAQFATFDTAFHMTLDEVAYTYGLPLLYRDQGVRRYGFHGISYAYCSKECAKVLNRPLEELKMVVCHLGAGASLCAIQGGKSIDTTMGMTPLEGLVMATRCGSLDPGIVLYLLKEQKKSIDALEKELNENSGLLGVSGISGDIRTLFAAAEQGNQRALFSLDLFVHQLVRCLGSMIASLKGVDAIVFTAGIGEHSAPIREKTCASFSFLGLELDRGKNEASSSDAREISSPASTIKVLVIPTQEEWEIAHQCRKLIDRRMKDEG